MKEFALTLDLKNDPKLIRQYEEHHRRVWPEVLKSLKAVGIMKMSIYRLGTRMFMFMETVDDFDPATDFAKYLTLDPKCQEWEDLMGKFQQALPEAKPGEKWLFMQKVFEL